MAQKRRKGGGDAFGDNDLYDTERVSRDWSLLPAPKRPSVCKDVSRDEVPTKVDDAPRSNTAEAQKPLLQRCDYPGSVPLIANDRRSMYETEEWSDLTVEASYGKSFKVHKTVVCSASKYFHAACTAGFRESHTNHVKLPESKTIVKAILEHFYEIPTLWLKPAFYSDRPALSKVLAQSYGQDLIDMRAAADKVLFSNGACYTY